MTTTPPLDTDLTALDAAFDAVERDARELIAGVSESQGRWQPAPGVWSLAECLDHLATANRVYLRAMEPVSERALGDGRARRGPARPGLLGGWFVWSLEPPPRPFLRTRAPRAIQPRVAPALGDAAAQFFGSHHQVRAYLRRYGGIDLTGVTFPNPFIRGVRFSLATGLHVIAAHERRHLWQAWRVRRAAEQHVDVLMTLRRA
jgi:DinB superfamily